MSNPQKPSGNPYNPYPRDRRSSDLSYNRSEQRPSSSYIPNRPVPPSYGYPASRSDTRYANRNGGYVPAYNQPYGYANPNYNDPKHMNRSPGRGNLPAKKESKMPSRILNALVFGILICILAAGSLFFLHNRLSANQKVIRWEKEIDYKSDGSIGCWITADYDEKGVLTHSTLGFSDLTDFDNTQETDYDSKGNVIRIKEYNGDCIEWEYDSIGRPVKVTYNLFHEELSYWCEYGYDRNGKENRFIRHEADGSESYWDYDLHQSRGSDEDLNHSEDTYDHKGRLIESATYSNGSRADRITYTYKHNQLKDQVIFNADDSVRREIHYEDGKIACVTGYNPDGLISQNESYAYNSEGLLVKTISSDGSSSSCVYEKDSDGNVTKCTVYSKDGSIESWKEYQYRFDEAK